MDNPGDVFEELAQHFRSVILLSILHSMRTRIDSIGIFYQRDSVVTVNHHL